MRYSTVWQSKGIIAGAYTLLDMAGMLQQEAILLLEMAAAGFQLTEPVSDDYAHIAIDTDDPKVAAEFGATLEDV